MYLSCLVLNGCTSILVFFICCLQTVQVNFSFSSNLRHVTSMHEAYLPANVITTTNVTFQIIFIVKKNPISKAIIDKNAELK